MDLGDFGRTAKDGVDPLGVFSSSFLIKINSAIIGVSFSYIERPLLLDLIYRHGMLCGYVYF